MSNLSILIQRWQEGDERAAEAIYNHHRESTFRLAYGLLGNPADAEEVLQTVYLKILQGKAIYRGESKLQTWLFAVIRKTAINERRKQWLRTLISIPGKTSDVHNELESEFERSEMQQRFQQALAQLPARQRETLHLVFYQDLSLSEAAGVMNISLGSARRHYERGKKHLRATLDREGVEYGIGWNRKENSSAVL